MDYKAYFDVTSGKGFLSTANAKGEVNTALYARPQVLDDGTFVFGMTDRLTHANLQENPLAVYAFNERGYSGKRFYLKKIKEESSGPLFDRVRLTAGIQAHPGAGSKVKFAVHFRVTKDIPLVVDECTGDHAQHICELAGNEKFDLISELAKTSNFMCINCGRMAEQKENLCNPMALGDMEYKQ